MLKIRLLRVGRKHQPSYKIVVVDGRRAPKSGKFVEQLGFYNPITKEKSFKKEKIEYWISNGAQPSDTLYNLLITEGILKGKKRKAYSIKNKGKKEVSKEEPKKEEESKKEEEPKKSDHNVSHSDAGGEEEPPKKEINKEETINKELGEEIKEAEQKENKVKDQKEEQPIKEAKKDQKNEDSGVKK